MKDPDNYKNRIITVIRNCRIALVAIGLIVVSTSAQAHIFGGHGYGSEVEYTCKPHTHGRFLHRCSDELHDPLDITHQHPGLPLYYARKPDFYLGVKTGALGVSSNDNEAVGSTTGFVVGYGTHNKSLEAELTTATIRPKDQYGFYAYNSEQGRYDTLAIYATQKMGGDVYFKIKGGIRKNWATRETGTVIKEGLSIGGGIGKQLGRFTLESEFTAFEINVFFYSLGMNYKF